MLYPQLCCICIHKWRPIPPAHQPAESAPETETELAAIAAQLAGECDDGDLHADPDLVDSLRLAILGGGDPLGDWLCQLRAPEIRRRDGAVYTPKAIVDAMVRWATGMGRPSRVVDAGAGTGRFLLSAGQVFPNAALVAVETDPLALAILRANARVLELDERLSVLPVDYRGVALPQISGTTLFLGNPPYVRHHGISKEWKEWFADGAQALGLKASRLAGMHVHFLLKTRQLARDGDFGAFITSSEWLDVNYGRLVRGAVHGRSWRTFAARHRTRRFTVRRNGHHRRDHDFSGRRKGQMLACRHRRIATPTKEPR